MTSRRCTRRCEKRRTKRTEPWHWSARCSPTRWSGSGGRTIPVRGGKDSTRTSGRAGRGEKRFTASRAPPTPIPIEARGRAASRGAEGLAGRRTASELREPPRLLFRSGRGGRAPAAGTDGREAARGDGRRVERSEEHTSELQSLRHLVCR